MDGYRGTITSSIAPDLSRRVDDLRIPHQRGHDGLDRLIQAIGNYNSTN
jgi:hypothetical protein